MISRILLENYHLLFDSTNPAMRDILIDLNRSIENAQLTDVEKKVIAVTYMTDHGAPIRSGLPGAPIGGGSQKAIVTSIVQVLHQAPRQRRATKIETEYNLVPRSIYWYKKVLNKALSKINIALNYEELDDLPAQTLRYMRQECRTQSQLV